MYGYYNRGNVTGEPDRIDGEFVSAAIATRQPRPTTISRYGVNECYC